MSDGSVYVWKFFNNDHLLSREHSTRRWLPGKELRAYKQGRSPSGRQRYVDRPELCVNGFHGSFDLFDAESYRRSMECLGIFKLSGKITRGNDKVAGARATLIASIDIRQDYDILIDFALCKTRRTTLKKRLFTKLRKMGRTYIIKSIQGKQ